MFNAKVKSEVLKGIIDVTSPLVNEVKFNITPKGISLRAVDPEHVAMVDLQINDKAFEELCVFQVLMTWYPLSTRKTQTDSL